MLQAKYYYPYFADGKIQEANFYNIINLGSVRSQQSNSVLSGIKPFLLQRPAPSAPADLCFGKISDN